MKRSNAAYLLRPGDLLTIALGAVPAAYFLDHRDAEGDGKGQ
jgi:hypothetical protein